MARADILVLKDGTRVEGTIQKESPDTVRMRYRLTPKIWDEKDFKRDDIKEVIKQTPQEVEIIELRKIVPLPDLTSADKYEQVIQNQLRPFVNKYPGTKEAKEVEEMIAKLQEEKSKVTGGQVKLDGKWLSPEETKAEQFNIKAYGYLQQIRESAAANKLTEALRKYSEFLRAGAILRATRYYPDIVTEVLDVLDKYNASLTAMATEQPTLKRTREEGLKKLEDADRKRSKDAIDQEVAEWRARSQSDRANKLPWTDPYKYDAASIAAAQKEVAAESQRLRAVNLDVVKSQNQAISPIFKALADKDYAAGVNAFNQIAYLSSDQKMKDVIDDLKARLRALYDEMMASRRASASSMTRSSSAAAGTADATKGQDELVSQILAANTGNAPGAMPAGQTGTAPAPAAARAAPAANAAAPAAPAQQVRPQTQPAVPQAAPRPAAPAQPTYAPAPQAPVAAALPPVEESHVQTYIMIGAGVLVLVLLVVFMQQKKKEREA
jgi:hypothetical protein